jgi:hypothetical protein|tara:strand:+ start:34 stop:306 length:273 start_codon:yes stop_codon:yes gene_type:complete
MEYFDSVDFAQRLAEDTFVPEGLDAEDACRIMASVIGVYLGLFKQDGVSDIEVGEVIESLRGIIKESYKATIFDEGGIIDGALQPFGTMQ